MNKLHKAVKLKKYHQVGAILLPICGLISASVAPDCLNPMIPGADAVFYLANKSDIASVTPDGTNPLIKTAITMVGAGTFFSYEGTYTSNSTKSTLVQGKNQPKYDHSISGIIFKVDGATKKQLEALAKGRVVAIVEYNYKGSAGNSAFEILGLDQGLQLSVLERDSTNADSDGGYSFTLKTPEAFKEGHLPAAFYDTDYATTKAAVLALL